MSHYSLALRPKLLQEWAKNTAQALRKELDDRYGKQSIPVFIYRGMSGIAHATALSLEWHRRYKNRRQQHGMVYVRKPGEKSHGSKVQTSIPNLNTGETLILVFVDDFVCSGDTRKQALEAFIKNNADLSDHWRSQFNRTDIISATGFMGESTPKVLHNGLASITTMTF